MALDFPTSPTDGQIYDNYYWDNTNSRWQLLGSALEVPANFSNTATGTYTDGYDYKYVSFTSDGTLTVTRGGYADVLVVAGGGGGGGGTPNSAGGGGAGGYIYIENYFLDAGNHDVVIGSGGASLTDGSESVLGKLIAVGGGAGQPTFGDGNKGGSGGGGGYISGTGGSGTLTQGNSGGNGPGGGATDPSPGGGGAGGAGESPLTSGSDGGDGGAGLSNSLTGSVLFYAGGGGGGQYNSPAGAGGSSVGGDGGVSGGAGNNAVANTGSGGGGGSRSGAGGSGSDGIVIVRVRV